MNKETCTCCGRELNADKMVTLGLDQRINLYHSGNIPEEFDQGGFPFGAACAKKEEKRALEKLQNL
jgi:hypothetical protein